jgi:probable F420-dependent oxidoreductase
MEIGLAVPQIGPFAHAELTRRVAVEAEAAGFASLWALDRLLAPRSPRTPYPGTPDGALPPEHATAMDPLVTLTLAAAVTSRVRLGTSVLVAPWYPPLLLARAAATLDQVSGGRFTLGLGLGWSADEYAAVGVPKRHLQTRMEEVLEVLGAVWRDDVVEVETSRERVAPSVEGLKPRQRLGPPLLLAAYTPAGLERIARRAHGWHPAGLPHELVAAGWASVREQAARYGRDAEALRLVVRANVRLTGEPAGAERPPFVGSLAEVRDDVARTRALGAHELVLDLQGASRRADQLLEVAGELAAGA